MRIPRTDAEIDLFVNDLKSGYTTDPDGKILSEDTHMSPIDFFSKMEAKLKRFEFMSFEEKINWLGEFNQYKEYLQENIEKQEEAYTKLLKEYHL